MRYKKATGTKIKGITKITPENLGDIMASRMSEAGKSLNAVSQAAKMLGKSTDDVEIKHLIEAAMDMGFLSRNFKDVEKLTDSATLGFIRSFQNKNVRLLVSNPSTSALNVVGWGANVALNTVSDVALASIHASRGAMLRVAKAKDAGKSDFDAAKLLYESTKMRIKLLLDPDMTHAAYQSALQKKLTGITKFKQYTSRWYN